MQLIAGSKGKRGALDCKHGGLREQEPAQPVAKGVQGAEGDGDAGAKVKGHKSATGTFPKGASDQNERE